MKNSLLHNTALLGFIASFFILPLSAVAAGTAFAIFGVLAVLFADYGRRIEPLQARADIVAFSPSHAPEIRHAA